MHIPDGFLSVPIAVGLDVAAVAVVAASARKTRASLGDAEAPLMGLLGAFVFAAQMINIPVPGGTSGHLLGGVLVASLVGPAAGTLVMTAVFLIQCLLFQDGGLLALGANLLNMGVFGTVVGYYLLRAGLKIFPFRAARKVLVFLACWLTIVLSSALVAVELHFSAPEQIPLGGALGAMMGWHALIGILEGAITVSVLSLLEKVRPSLLEKTFGEALR